jgi:hypothetical protein
MTSPEVASPEMTEATSPEVTSPEPEVNRTVNQREIIFRAFSHWIFAAFFQELL